MEKEIKEITTKTDRWIRIKKDNLEVTISSPNKEDKMNDMIDKADKLIEKHSNNKSYPNYTQ